MRRANAAGVILQRGKRPGLAHRIQHLQRQLRRPRVTGFQLVERACQLAIDAARFDVVVPQNAREIGISKLEELEEPVFDLDIVIGPGQAQAGGAFERPAAGGVQLGCQSSWIDRSHGNLLREG